MTSINPLHPQPNQSSQPRKPSRRGGVLDLRPLLSRKQDERQQQQKVLEQEAVAVFSPTQRHGSPSSLALQDDQVESTTDTTSTQTVIRQTPLTGSIDKTGAPYTPTVDAGTTSSLSTPSTTFDGLDTHVSTASQPSPTITEPSFSHTRKENDQPHRTIIWSVLGFTVLLMIILMPATCVRIWSAGRQLSARVISNATTAVNHLNAAADALMQHDVTRAQTELDAASTSWIAAVDPVQYLLPWSNIIKHLPWKGETVASDLHLLFAGQTLTTAAAQGVSLIHDLQATDLASAARDPDQGITLILQQAQSRIREIQQTVAIGTQHLQRVSLSTVPTQQRDDVQRLQAAAPLMTQTLDQAYNAVSVALAFLGTDQEQRYLVLFANNRELRPVGGFPGAMAFIRIRHGVVTNLDVPGGGIYDLAGQSTTKVISPTPLHLVNGDWELQDALWWPDFPTSAKKVEWFLQQAQGPSIDGVIVVTPTVIEKLLGVVGPIDMQDNYGLTIDQYNFYQEIQVLAEQKYDVTTESKAILSDLTPALFNTLLTSLNQPDKLTGIVDVLQTSLEQKDIVLFHNDQSAQALITQLGWAGDLAATTGDYLAVVDTNIAGGKTNAMIDQTIDHQASIADDGTITDTVTIRLEHKGDPADLLSGVVYKDYLRLYVPADSQLQSATGFNPPDPKLFLAPSPDSVIDEDLQRISGQILVDDRFGVSVNQEFGKQVFGGWAQVAPGDSTTITVQYILPFRLPLSVWKPTNTYTLFVQKQAGSFTPLLKHQLHLPESWSLQQVVSPTVADGPTILPVEHDLLLGGLIHR